MIAVVKQPLLYKRFSHTPLVRSLVLMNNSSNTTRRIAKQQQSFSTWTRNNRFSPTDAYDVPLPPLDYKPRGSRGKIVNRTVKDIVPTSNPSTPVYNSWKMVRFDIDGKVRVVDVPRSDLYSRFGLQGRDIRIVVSNMTYPTILARKHCIILDIKNLSAIITENSMYLLKNDSFDPSIIPFIQQEIKYHRTASKIMQQELFKSNQRTPQSINRSESHESDHYHTQQYGYFEHSHALPFEFQMLECILHKACREIEAEYDVLQAQVRRTLHDPNLGNSEDLLFEILQHKKHMNKFNTFVREMYETVEALLQSDEDMASMYLTETHILNRPRAVQNHEEVEMLLETYYTQLEDIINRIEELKNDMNSTQDFLEICLDAVRNRMIEYDLKMTIAGFAITMGTLLAGLFGMNLLNHWEQSPNAFFWVSAGICAMSICAFSAVMVRLKRRGVFSSSQYFNMKNRRLHEAQPQNARPFPFPNGTVSGN